MLAEKNRWWELEWNRFDLFFFDVYFNSGVDSTKCTDWTTIRRAGYKPGLDELSEPQYTAMRGSSSKNKEIRINSEKKEH
jgi:hypothetical protein